MSTEIEMSFTNRHWSWKKCISMKAKQLYLFCTTPVSRSAINLKFVIIIRFCMADELNRQALPIHHTNPYKNYNFQNEGTSRYFGLWLRKLVHLLNLVCSIQWCFIHGFDQTLAEQLFRDKGLWNKLFVYQSFMRTWSIYNLSTSMWCDCFANVFIWTSQPHHKTEPVAVGKWAKLACTIKSEKWEVLSFI